MNEDRKSTSPVLLMVYLLLGVLWGVGEFGGYRGSSWLRVVSALLLVLVGAFVAMDRLNEEERVRRLALPRRTRLLENLLVLGFVVTGIVTLIKGATGIEHAAITFAQISGMIVSCAACLAGLSPEVSKADGRSGEQV